MGRKGQVRSGTNGPNLQHAVLVAFTGSAFMARLEGGMGGRVGKAARSGIVLMLLGMFLFSLNDAMGKMLVSTYSIGEVLLIRSLAALIILVPFLGRRGLGGLVEVERPLMQAIRVALSTFEVFCFYFAVSQYPLADVMTFWLACPIYVAALAPLLLGEKVGWRRWTAILVGFAGVVIALQPSSRDFGAATIVSIIGPLAFAAFIVMGRSLRGTPDTTLVFWQIIGALAAGAVISPFAWVTPDLVDAALLGLLGVVAMGAHVLVNRSLKLSDASTLAPLQYSLLLWAILFGYLFFGDVPGMAVYVGAALITGAGVYIVLRERQLALRRAAITET